ncbi:MAG TPA: hypothetical protein VMM38_09335 [Aridibacter sp.]|nr:hypothetical protein [Aridibacter sp.]
MRQRPLMPAIALVACLVTGSCGDPATIANGEVRDELGSPLEGVEVVMESEIADGFRKESEQKTGSDGKFNFVTVTGAARVVRLRFNKEGFREEIRGIPAMQSSSHRIVLNRD